MIKVFKHKDYKEYYDAQLKKYYRKKNNVWVKDNEIKMISNHIKKNVDGVKEGLCHGTRTGWEIQQFKKRLECNVIGTEIAPNNTPDTIEWDFHNIKNEWIEKFDFIYSNSFDHSNRPQHCIKQWMKCLKPGGICYVTWMSSLLKRLDAADCISSDLKDYRKIFNKNYQVIDEFKTYTGRIVFAIKHKEKKDE